jgi:hypothetical protein
MARNVWRLRQTIFVARKDGSFMSLLELFDNLLIIALLILTTPLLALVCVYGIHFFGKPRLW